MPKGYPKPKKLKLVRKDVPKVFILNDKPWERQSGESDKAFAAFCCYRDMSISERSIQLAANRLNKSPAHLAEWSQRYLWVERVSAYQGYLDQKAIEARIESIKKMHEEDRQRERTLGLNLIGKVAERFTDKKRPVRVADHQIPTWVKTGVDLIRISDGLSTGRTDVTVGGNPDGMPVMVEHRYILVDGVKPPMKEIPATILPPAAINPDPQQAAKRKSPG